MRLLCFCLLFPTAPVHQFFYQRFGPAARHASQKAISDVDTFSLFRYFPKLHFSRPKVPSEYLIFKLMKLSNKKLGKKRFQVLSELEIFRPRFDDQNKQIKEREFCLL